MFSLASEQGDLLFVLLSRGDVAREGARVDEFITFPQDV
jgi:hypothetical protein